MRPFLCLAALSLPALAWQSDGSFDRNLTVNGPVTLDVETNSGGITVRAGDASSVHIHATIRANRNNSRISDQQIHAIETNPPVVQTGNSIRITRISDEWLRNHISINYDIATPAQSSLRSRTGSGNVTIEGIHGPVDASTGSGNVDVRRIGDETRVRTGSGTINLDTVHGRVDAQTGSGGIDARAVAGPSVLHTGSGNVRLDQNAAGEVRAHTGSGSVNVRLPGTAGFDLRAHTGSGTVHVDQPITESGSINPHNLAGKVRGGGALVDVSTGSGQVRIE